MKKYIISCSLNPFKKGDEAVNCFYHPQETAVGQCRCGKFLCLDCVKQTSTVICMDCLQVVYKAKIKESQQQKSKLKQILNRLYAIENKRFSVFISAQLILILIAVSFFLVADEIDLLARILISYNFYTFPIMMYYLIKFMIQIRVNPHTSINPWKYLKVATQVSAFYFLIALFILFAEKQVEWPFIPEFLINFHLFIFPIILGTYFSWNRWKNRPVKPSSILKPPKPTKPKTLYRTQHMNFKDNKQSQ